MNSGKPKSKDMAIPSQVHQAWWKGVETTWYWTNFQCNTGLASDTQTVKLWVMI